MRIVVFIWGERKDPKRWARQGLFFNIKCSFLHSSFCEETSPCFKSVPSNLCFKESYTPQRRLQQSVGSNTRQHGQRRGNHLEIIFQRRKGKPRAWVPGSQTCTRKLWVLIPTAKASCCDSIQSSALCLDLNQADTDGEKNILYSKRKGATGSKITKDLTITNLFYHADSQVSLHWWAKLRSR